MHYYVVFSDYLVGRLWFKALAGDFMNFLSFLILALIGYLVFLGLRIIFVKFIKAESTPGLHKWGGIIIGTARGFLLASLIVFALAISGLDYVHKSVGNSYLGRYWVGVGSSVYSGIWKNIMSKFMNAEKFNPAILNVRKGLSAVKK
jgi:succinate dehydrogenase hydrophobic anchor subunit